MVVNCVSRRRRGGSSAWRKAAVATARATGSAAVRTASNAASTTAGSQSKLASVRRKSRLPSSSSNSSVSASRAVRLRALTSPPRPFRQARIWASVLSSGSPATLAAMSRHTRPMRRNARSNRPPEDAPEDEPEEEPEEEMLAAADAASFI